MAEQSSPAFSREQANALVEEITKRLLELRDWYAEMAGHREKVRTLAPRNGGESNPEVAFRAAQEVAEGLNWFQERGIIVRDVEQGIIDFPSIRNGEEILLCWQVGEPAV